MIRGFIIGASLVVALCASVYATSTTRSEEEQGVTSHWFYCPVPASGSTILPCIRINGGG